MGVKAVSIYGSEIRCVNGSSPTPLEPYQSARALWKKRFCVTVAAQYGQGSKKAGVVCTVWCFAINSLLTLSRYAAVGGRGSWLYWGMEEEDRGGEGGSQQQMRVPEATNPSLSAHPAPFLFSNVENNMACMGPRRPGDLHQGRQIFMTTT